MMAKFDRQSELLHGQTIFGNIHEKNVTFCIDTSGSMYNCLNAIKDHLCDALSQMASKNIADSTFNVIEFSTTVTKWSDKMVKCTEETVALAKEWIRSLGPKTGTNTLDALVTAFSDDICEAVYLVTDGLPDQQPNIILDEVAYVAKTRPVHCFYIQQELPDSSAVSFLQELAMDTYGSFHIITVTQHGFIERVTPVYRADMSAERIIRTASGNIYPSNNRVCSMTATVNDAFAPLPYSYPAPPWFPWQLYPYPFRHYFRHSYPYANPFGPNMAKMYPYYGWSQFRPARAWLKHAEDFIDAAGNPASLNSPGPGSLLIGKRVLARRETDGFFYLSTVNSQLMNEKFLVAMGPCKHGKYTDTTYQETFVYDIIAHDDALRHTILKGDRVLAPWQPDGERYGPGIVIDGQEKRIAEGSSEDKPLVVSFHNGQTATIPANTAVWIPRALFDRVTLELKLPPGVKRNLAEEEEYPKQNVNGYPTSGPVADPEQFSVGDPHSFWPPPWMLHNGFGYGLHRGFYRYPCYAPMFSLSSRGEAPVFHESSKTETTYETDTQKSLLASKVASQIAEYENRQTSSGPTISNLSSTAEHNKENIGKRSSKNRNIRFKEDDGSDIEAEYSAGDLEVRDSAIGSLSDPEPYDSETETGYSSGKETSEMRDVGVGTHGRTYRCQWPRRSFSAGPRPPWRYWRNTEAPSMYDPLHYGPYAAGPYQESVPPVPLESKQVKTGSCGAEWTAPVNCYVDTFACHKTSPGIFGSPIVPRPPSQARDRPLNCSGDPALLIGSNQLDRERRQDALLEFRRRDAQLRKLQWQKAVAERVKMRESVEERRRADTQRHLEWDLHRQRSDVAKMQQQHDARRALNEEVRQRALAKQYEELAALQQRNTLAQRRTEQRTLAQMRDEQIAAGLAIRKLEMTQERIQARHDVHSRQLSAEDARMQMLEANRRNAARYRSDRQRAQTAKTTRQIDIEVKLRSDNRGVHPSMLVH